MPLLPGKSSHPRTLDFSNTVWPLGYQPNVNVRSCITDKAAEAKFNLTLTTEAEETGYEGNYFPIASSSTGSGTSTPTNRSGFIQDTPSSILKRRVNPYRVQRRRLLGIEDHPVGEAIFFRYGVAVFYGFERNGELDILEDFMKQGIMTGAKKGMTTGDQVPGAENEGEGRYEMESFHFEYEPSAATPRIYNDFFSK